MSKADSLGGSATFDAVAQPLSSRAASFARFAGQDVAPADSRSSTARNAPLLPLTALAHNPFNPREELKAIDDLADSLASRGVIQPLTAVTRAAFLAAHPGQEESLAAAEYVVVDGNRRLAAANRAGLDEVPVHVDDSHVLDADTLLETALIAAVHNESLDPLDEAKVLERLVGVHGSQRAVARALGKSSGWVTQRMALLTLAPDLKAELEEGRLPVEVARRVGRLPEPSQQQAVEEALSQRATKQREKRETRRGAYAVSTPEEGSGRKEGAYGVSTPSSRTPAAGGAVVRAGAQDVLAGDPERTPSSSLSSSPSPSPSSSPLPDQRVTPPVPETTGVPQWASQVPWEAPEELCEVIATHMDGKKRRALIKLLLDLNEAEKQAVASP